LKITKFPEKPKVPKLIYRENVKISGIPFIWHTNLSDEDIKGLYKQLVRKQFFIRKLTHIETFETGVSIELGDDLINDSVDFKDLECRIYGFGNELTVACRSEEEWAILDAEEKKREKHTTVQEKVKDECFNLCKKANELMTKKSYCEAEGFLREAINLKLRNPNIQFFCYPETFLPQLFYYTGDIESALKLFSELKVQSPKNFKSIPYQWYLFGLSFERVGDTENAERIYKDGIKNYPLYGELYKRLCLMYERSSAASHKFCPR